MSTPSGGRASPGWAWLSGLVVTGLAATLLQRLAAQAARARPYSDECFHAYVAEWIASHGRLPERLPEFYGGLFFYYPPLLHLLGAAWVKLFGAASLVRLDVVLLGLLLAVLAFLPIPGVGSAPRRWAVLLCLANGWLATYAVRFYAEMLTCFLGLVVVIAVVRHHQSEQRRDALVAGIATGLALLAKPTTLVLPPLLVGLAVAAFVARRPARARGLLLAAGVGVAIGLPYFIRNAVLYGSPIYPALAPGVDPVLLQLYQTRPGGTLRGFFAESGRAIGPYVIAMGVAGLVAAALRRRGGIVVVLLALCPLGVAVALLSPIHDARYMGPLIAVVALLGSILLHEALRARPRIVAGLEAVLLVLAAVSVIRLADIRRHLDVPGSLAVAYQAGRGVVPKDATVLSLWTYDTFYHTRRASTWPLPWGGAQRLTELFRTEDPEQFLALLKRERIDYLLVSRSQPSETFSGANYNRSFITCVTRLINEGKLRVVWKSQALGWLEVSP